MCIFQFFAWFLIRSHNGGGVEGINMVTRLEVGVSRHNLRDPKPSGSSEKPCTPSLRCLKQTRSLHLSLMQVQCTGTPGTPTILYKSIILLRFQRCKSSGFSWNGLGFARDEFFHGKDNFLLYTNRAHFYKRFTIK